MIRSARAISESLLESPRSERDFLEALVYPPLPQLICQLCFSQRLSPKGNKCSVTAKALLTGSVLLRIASPAWKIAW